MYIVNSQNHGVFHMQTIQSKLSVAESAQKLIEKINELGLVLVAHVNHSKAATNAGLSLRASELVIFGNPKVGTLLMQNNPTAGLDLPLKILIWEDGTSQTQISYDEMEAIKTKRNISDSDEVLQKMNGALSMLANHAAGN